MKDADFAPTVQQQEAYEVLKERLNEGRVLMERLLEVEMPALNERLRTRGMPVISD